MYRTIDLFAGIGGIRRGFEMTGHFQNVLSAETDVWACKTYELLYGDNPRNDVTSKEFLDKVHQTPFDVLLAGFPCQAFSILGRKLGFKDATRGTLFHSMAEIIASFSPEERPKALFLENVEHLLQHDNQNTMNTILHRLIDELGYKIVGVTRREDRGFDYTNKTLVRNSCYFGVPQNRKRTYLIAFNRAIFGDAVDSLPGLPEKGDEVIYDNIVSVLESHADEKFFMSQGYLDTLKRHKERQKRNGNNFGYRVVNPKGGEPELAGAVLATGGSGKERNMVYDPVEEYVGRIVKRKKSPLNDEGLRFMTPLEWARLQGFAGYAFMKNGVDSFHFPEKIPNLQKYKQLGNSVTIPVIKRMAEFMFECFYILGDEC